MANRRKDDPMITQIFEKVSENSQKIIGIHDEVAIVAKAVESHVNGDHHRFINQLIEERERKKERVEKIKTQVWGWGIIVLLSSIGTAVYGFFIKNSRN